MRISSIYARDFCALNEVKINLDGSVTVLSGDNGAGKTSVFRALLAALGGKRAVPDMPVRNGATDSEIRVATDDGFDIVARITPDRGYRVDVTAGKMAVKSPAKWLADTFGSLDALAFLGMDPQGQADAIRKIAGVDTSELDADRARVYADRRDIGRDAKRLRAAADDIRPTERLEEGRDYAAELSAAEQADRDRARILSDRRATEARIDAQGPARKRMAELEEMQAGRPDLASTQQEIADRSATVEQLTAELAAAKMALNAAEIHARALDQVAAELDRLAEQLTPVELPEVPPEVDVAAARRLANLEAAIARWVDADAKATATENEYQRCTEEIERIDTERAALLAAAKFPVDGLGFDDTGLTLNGVPFSQASQAQRMSTSLAVACAREPKPPILFVQDAALLDAHSLAAVREIAEREGVHVMVERVADEPGSVRIEAGRVAE